MSETGFKSDIMHVEYRGEHAVLPVVTNELDMHDLVESRLKPGLATLQATIPDEYVEYAGFAVSDYTVPAERWVNKYPETAEAFAGSLVLADVAVNRMTSGYTQDYFVGNRECLDNMGRRAFIFASYDHRGVWPQHSFTEDRGIVVGPVVRTNRINGVYIPTPTDQHDGINFRSEFAVFVPSPVLLEWLKGKYPALREGYGVQNRDIARLFTQDFGLVPTDTTYDDWITGLRLRQLAEIGEQPCEKD